MTPGVFNVQSDAFFVGTEGTLEGYSGVFTTVYFQFFVL